MKPYEVYFCLHSLRLTAWLDHEPTPEDIEDAKRYAREHGQGLISLRWLEPVQGDDEHVRIFERTEKLS